MSRELSRLRRPEARGSALLSDLARLPLEAAVDMVCAEFAALPQLPGGGVSGGGLRGLPELVARIEDVAHAEGPRAAGAAARLLGAGALAGGLGGGAADQVARLAAVVLRDGDDSALTRLTAALVAEPTQLGTALLGPLVQRCRRDPGARVIVVEAMALSLAQERRSWREHGGADAVDGLASALIEQAVARADLRQACVVARLWPPMRTALQRLGSALAGAEQLTELSALADVYDVRGGLFTALMTVVTTVAVFQGSRGEATLRWVFGRRPSAATFCQIREAAPDRWLAIRPTLVALAVADGTPPWLMDAIRSEPDAVEALSAVLEMHPHREDLVAAVRDALLRCDPWRAFEAGCVAVLDQGRPSASQVEALQRAAAALGQPTLATDWLALVQREFPDPPLDARLQPRIGRGGSF